LPTKIFPREEYMRREKGKKSERGPSHKKSRSCIPRIALKAKAQKAGSTGSHNRKDIGRKKGWVMFSDKGRGIHPQGSGTGR